MQTQITIGFPEYTATEVCADLGKLLLEKDNFILWESLVKKYNDYSLTKKAINYFRNKEIDEFTLRFIDGSWLKTNKVSKEFITWLEENYKPEIDGKYFFQLWEKDWGLIITIGEENGN